MTTQPKSKAHTNANANKSTAHRRVVIEYLGGAPEVWRVQFHESNEVALVLYYRGLDSTLYACHDADRWACGINPSDGTPE